MIVVIVAEIAFQTVSASLPDQLLIGLHHVVSVPYTALQNQR